MSLLTILLKCIYINIYYIIKEAARQEQINKATGEATALISVAEARAKSLQLVANSLSLKDAKNAAALSIAEQYVNAFNKLAKINNTIILPSNVGDATSLITQVSYFLFSYKRIALYSINKKNFNYLLLYCRLSPFTSMLCLNLN